MLVVVVRGKIEAVRKLTRYIQVAYPLLLPVGTCPTISGKYSWAGSLTVKRALGWRLQVVKGSNPTTNINFLLLLN
jgi:hypothetical protein